ncbi:hypothetical protein H3C66_02245 [Patescibacteria group bacterium]|nr:hypothetical protein [Patescibacteria group bacterium]
MTFSVLFDVSQLLIAFLVIWLGAGLLLNSIEKLSKLLHLSQFTLSLFLLGTATSFPEIAVLVNALILKEPEVAMGNLIGGQVFLLFAVIPLLAIITRGLRLQAQMQGKLLLLIISVVAVPLVTLMDGKVQTWEGFLTLVLYGTFVITFSRKMTALERITKKLIRPPQINPVLEIGKVLGGVVILLLATQLAIRGVTNISAHYALHPFLVSMIVMALGTNLPEFSLAVRGALSGKRDIVLGDYIGSATMNTLLWAVLVFASPGTIYMTQTVLPMIFVIVTGLLLFWYFCRTHKKLSIGEGLILILVYAAFLGVTTWMELGF